MDRTEIGLVGIGVLLFLILLRMPVGVALVAVSFAAAAIPAASPIFTSISDILAASLASTFWIASAQRFSSSVKSARVTSIL